MAESYPGSFRRGRTLLRRARAVDVHGRAVVARHEWQPPAGVSRRTGLGRPVDAVLAVLAGDPLGPVTYAKPALWLTSLERMFGWEMVQKTLRRVLRSRHVSSSDAGRVVRHRVVGRGPDSDVVLRRRASQRGDVRLRRRRRVRPAARLTIDREHRRRPPAPGRACFPSKSGRRSTTGGPRASAGTGAIAGGNSSTAATRRVRTVEIDPDADADARPELHEQLVDRGSRVPRRPPAGGRSAG